MSDEAIQENVNNAAGKKNLNPTYKGTSRGKKDNQEYKNQQLEQQLKYY
jgi:hypothetical protein